MNTPSAVLLVDDDPTTNYLNQRLLGRLAGGSEILTATNGRQGLDLLRGRGQPAGASGPVLVLLDLHMPGMNGFDFLEELLVLPLEAALVVVVLTSSELERDLSRLRHLPITDFLTKPLTAAKLTDVLDRYFKPLASRS